MRTLNYWISLNCYSRKYFYCCVVDKQTLKYPSYLVSITHLGLWLYLWRCTRLPAKFNCSIIVRCQIVAEMQLKRMRNKKACTFTWLQSSRSTKFYQDSTWFQSALNRDPIMGVSIDVWRRRISGCYGSRGPRINKRRREGAGQGTLLGTLHPLHPLHPATLLGTKDTGKVWIQKICPLHIYLFNNTPFSFGTGGIFSPTCPSLCSWYWVFNNLTLQHCVLATLWYWPLHWGSGLWLVQRWNNMHWFFYIYCILIVGQKPADAYREDHRSPWYVRSAASQHLRLSGPLLCNGVAHFDCFTG